MVNLMEIDHGIIFIKFSQLIYLILTIGNKSVNIKLYFNIQKELIIMKIKGELAKVKELVELYIEGLTVSKEVRDTISVTWYSEVQRIVENAIVTYSKEDIEMESFLEPFIEVVNDKIIIKLLKEDMDKIIIKIPFTKEKELMKLINKIEMKIEA